MAAPWILLFLAFLFFMGPFRRRAWRRARWDFEGDSSKPDRHSLTTERDERDRQREEHIETLESRVTELESRLDYAERLLAQRREPAAPVLGVSPQAS